MQIYYHKRFIKQMKKLQVHERIAVTDAIDLFRKDPFSTTLKNHALKGSMLGARAISAGFDLRILFEEHDNYTLVVMVAVGTHDTVYPHN